jgi:hypothetical protein
VSSDALLVRDLIALHFAAAPSILDTTWGKGALWRGCPYQPTVRLDARPLLGVDVVGDWRELGSLFSDRRFEVVCWDPPHQCDGGTGALGGDWADDYGTPGAELRGQASIAVLYP